MPGHTTCGNALLRNRLLHSGDADVVFKLVMLTCGVPQSVSYIVPLMHALAHQRASARLIYFVKAPQGVVEVAAAFARQLQILVPLT